MATVKEIVKKYLEDNKFDGLFSDGECACIIDDLAPCDGICFECEAGYKHEGDSEYDFYIKPDKPTTS